MTQAPHRTDAASDALTALVARLRDAELAPTVRELADSLWLAAQVAACGEGDEGDGARRPEADRARPARSDGAPGEADPHWTPAPPAPTPHPPPRPAPRSRLVVPVEDGGGPERPGGVPVQVPAAAVLPDPLALQRALRPLQRYRPPVRPVPRDLDEQATAERAADTGLVVPVLRHARRREARLLLVMDLSTSTVVWEQALGELRHVCERSGAFREVQVQFLHEGADGRPGYAATARPGAALQDPGRLSDPTGSRLTLVLSDCAGPMWRGGLMQRLLYRWGSLAPVAVVQPLPQRMWRRTHLPARRGHLHRWEGPAGHLEFEPAGGGGARGRPRRGIPVPVLALRRSSVEGWAKLVSGATGQSLEAAAGLAEAGHGPSAAPVRARQEVGGRERVRAFRRTASPAAWQLAVYLSAVPTILPVMQLVQRAMLAGSGPEVLAEVLLGGLLKRSERDDDPEVLAYQFLDGVEEELIGHLAPDDARLLQKHCSDYLERRFGRSVHNFPATAVALLGDAGEPAQPPGTGGEADHPGLRAFAEVSGEVLRRFLPRTRTEIGRDPGGGDATALRVAARAARERYAQGRQARELDRAVDLLEAAVGAAPAGAGRDAVLAELGETLFLRWTARRSVADLREALRAAATIADRPPQTRLLLGAVLMEIAEEVERAGTVAAALPDEVRVRAARLADGPPRGPRGTRGALWAEYLLLNDATAELLPIPAHIGDDPSHPGWPAQRALAETLGRLAVVAARLVEGGVRVGGASSDADPGRGAAPDSGGTPGEQGYGSGAGGAPGPAFGGRGEGVGQGAGSGPGDAPNPGAPSGGRGSGAGPGGVPGSGSAAGVGQGPWGGAAGVFGGRVVEGGPGRGGLADTFGGASGAVPRIDFSGGVFLGPVAGERAGSAGADGAVQRPAPRAGHLDLGDVAFHGSTLGRPRHGVDGPRPQDVYVDFMRRAVDTTGVLTLGPDPADGFLLRGRLRKRLARHCTGRGEIAREGGDRGAPDGTAIAADACDDLQEALARGTFAADERSLAWLDLAEALQLAWCHDADEGGQRLIHTALEEALEAADGDHGLTLACHVRGADVYWARHLATGLPVHRQLAIEGWTNALPLTARDDPSRVVLMSRLGTALAQRGVATASVADTDDAVRRLREAVDATPPRDPGRDERRMQLANAYIARFHVQRTLADLHEAEWLLGAVARNVTDPVLAAYCLLRRGEVAAQIFARTGLSAQLHWAAEYYREAAETAVAAGEPSLAAEAHQSYAEALEELGDPERALTEYREARRLLPEYGPRATYVRADEIHAAITRLAALLREA
ncbi:SAV_2336 N-terminal domain-related protein [Streptomyces sp. NPDC050732]|uniref:SAV_2336 N-terminal domain-related protein n=1 Tax=Streptomyces sp. NPDC050732 TaxID=3154632 RepID=UPI00343FF42B